MDTAPLLVISDITDADVPAIIALWQRCGLTRPWNDPDHRGRDLGRAIMAAAEDWLRARGIAKLMLMVRGDNTKVQAFYQTLDYAVQDSVVFSKWLDGRPPTPGMK